MIFIFAVHLLSRTRNRFFLSLSSEPVRLTPTTMRLLAITTFFLASVVLAQDLSPLSGCAVACISSAVVKAGCSGPFVLCSLIFAKKTALLIDHD
jgi:hypothetical protein